MEINFLNTRSVIVLICVLQGAVFAALLFRRGRKNNTRSDYWLAGLLLLLCSNLITPFIGFANVYDNNQWLTYFPFSVAYSLGVCVYFYVLSLTNPERRFERKNWLLFIPSVIYLLFRLTLFAQNLEFKNWFDDNFYAPFVAPFVFVTEFLWNLILAIIYNSHLDFANIFC